MAAHLWTGEAPPKEYVILALCRLYHCPPSALKKEDPHLMLDHLTCVKWENEVQRTEASRNDRLHNQTGT